MGDAEFRIKPQTSKNRAEADFKLTEVSDPDGDALVENVEDHDDDKADDRGRDRRDHLRRHVLLQRLQLLHVLVSVFAGEDEEDGQAVHDDGRNGRQDQQNLKDKEAIILT